MARKGIRRSQAVVPFGVGAMIDFPGECLMSAGLDVWPVEPQCVIRDDRLARRLGVEYFRAPPPSPQEHQIGAYLPFVRFPLWHFCPRCRALSPTRWNESGIPRCAGQLTPRFGGKPCESLPERRRWRMVPVRFVVACPNGHIDDFPWVRWSHGRPGQSLAEVQACPSPRLRLNYTGKTGLMGLLVKCEACDARARSLMGSAGPDSLKGLICSGQRPWLGPSAQEACDQMPRSLQRGGSNIYFAKVASSILIPPFTTPLRDIIDDDRNWSFLTTGMGEDGNVDDARVRMLAELRGLEYSALKAAVEQKFAGAGLDGSGVSEEEYRNSEYRALMGPSGNPEDAFVLRPQAIDGYPPIVREYFERIVLVEKLAETRALTGFARITPPPYREFDRGDQSQLSLQPRNWLPALRVHGEGLFLTLRRSVISNWVTDHVLSRTGVIAESYRRMAIELGRRPRALPAAFFLLHTLAHVLIRRLSFECGYGSSALRERIYCHEGGDRDMAGILIYTAAGDCEGTMGGLVQQGKPGRFEGVLRGAIHDALWCSSDPLCIESRGQGTDSLNLAACHACALLPETSCEEGNRLLDRGILVGTSDEPELGFFSNLVETIIL